MFPLITICGGPCEAGHIIHFWFIGNRYGFSICIERQVDGSGWKLVIAK